MRILDNVLLGRIDVRVVLQGDEALIRKEQKRSRLVRHIVRDRNLCALRKVLQILRLARIDAEGLIVNCRRADQLRASLLVEVLKIGQVLEVVCIEALRLECEVRLHIVGVLDHLELIALCLERLLRSLQNLCVRGRGCADRDHLVAGSLCRAAACRAATCLTAARCAAVSRSAALRLLLASASREQRQSEKRCRQKYLFLHFCFLPNSIVVIFSPAEAGSKRVTSARALIRAARQE